MKINLKYIIAGAVAAVIIAGTVTCAVFSAINMNNIRNVQASIDLAQKKAEEEETAEEDPEYVKIDDIYEIKPTNKISDAYISGDQTGLTDDEKATLEEASKVIDEVVKDNMTLYEKEKALYDWVTTNISNDFEGMTAKPQQLAEPGTVLASKKGVCVGFATTYKLLVNMIGIECMVMHDFEKSHSWDLLKLDDGCWYICDCYMGVSSKWSNFNMNQDYALSSHNFDASKYPVANGYKYFPAFADKKDIYKAEDIIKLMAEYIDAKGEYMSVCMKKTDKSKMQLDYIISNIITRLNMEPEYIDYNVANIEVEGVEYTLAVLNRGTYSEFKDLDEYTTARYDRLITHQFGEAEEEGDDDFDDSEPVG